MREIPSAGDLPLLEHPEWAAEFPWLTQGVSHRGAGAEPFDLGLSDGAPSEIVRDRWQELALAVGARGVVAAPQPHSSEVLLHDAMPAGLFVSEPADGHATRRAGLLLGVTIADCVPVSVVDPTRRAVALLHAGWRGTVAGVLEAGLSVLRDCFGSDASGLRAHLGPAICGRCYEVGAGVPRALGLPVAGEPHHVDLRDVLSVRCTAWGIPAEAMSRSELCTRCGDADLFSHRRGDSGRQVAFLGVRA